jgi:putative FmdB family regulatory protein
MPHYDYVCSSCEHEAKDVFQKITDAPIQHCPNCQKQTFRRLPGGGIGLQFKGEGFYINDYDSNKKSSSEQKVSDHKGCGCGKSACNA